MPQKRIKFEGKEYIVPNDATMDEIAEAVGVTAAPPAPPKPDIETRIPSGIGMETMENRPVSAVTDALKGVAGLPQDLSQMPRPSLRDILSRQLNPLNNVKTAADMIGGLASGVANAPGNLMSGDPYRIGQGLNTVLQAAPAAAAAKSGASSLMGRLRKTPVVAPEIAAIEQKLRGSGNEKILTSEEVAPKLAKYPKLAATPAGPKFDQALFGEFKGAGAKVRLFEGMVPDNAPVNISEPLRGIKGLQADFAGSASDDAVKALDWAASRIDRFKGAANLDDYLRGSVQDKSMPWGQFIEVKRGLADKMKTLGVFRRIAQGTATDKDVALNRAYGHLIEASNKASTAAKVPLSNANAEFSLMSDAVHSANLSLETGRRIPEIAKPPATLGRRALDVTKKVAPYAVGFGAAGAAAREVLK